MILRTLEAKDIWGTEVPGKISHNFSSNVTPRGENAMTGDPGITLAEGRPLRPPYYTIAGNSPILNLTNISTAPGVGALNNSVPLLIPTAK